MSVDITKLFEQLNEAVDSPIEYNSIISKTVSDLINNFVSVTWVDGIAYLTEPVSGLNISTQRPVVTAGQYGLNLSNLYLKIDQVTTMGDQGFYLPRKAVVTGLWAKSRNNQSWQVQLRKNGNPISLASADIVNSFGQETGLSILLDEGDTLQLFASGTKIDHPIAGVEIAWRL